MLRIALPFILAPIAVLAAGIATGRADDARLAVALSCPAAVPGPDCSRETALDVVAAPRTARRSRRSSPRISTCRRAATAS